MDNNYNDIFNCVYENIDLIMDKYNDILNPVNNNTTKKYLDEFNEEKYAYALSFTTTLLLYFQITNFEN